MSPTRENMILAHSLPLLPLRQRHRARQHWLLALCAVGTFAYVTHWLLHHSFAQEPHHYITALVLVGWLASFPFVFAYHFLTGRRKHHGLD